MDYFCFSDIHGHKDLFDKIYSWLNGRAGEWKCIFLGDACDRREYGYEIIKTLLNDERFIYLKGNHEDLFVRAAKALKGYWLDDNVTRREIMKNPYECIVSYTHDFDISLHIQNGGLNTLIAWAEDGAPLNIIGKLDKLPERFTLPHNVWGELEFTHAGHLMDESDSVLWSRQHFQEKYTKGRMIHGHTPVRYLMKYVVVNGGATNRAAVYQDNTKICVDTAAFISDTTVLLNCETFDQHLFTTLI